MSSTINTGRLISANLAADRAKQKQEIPTTTLGEEKLFKECGIRVDKLSDEDKENLNRFNVIVKKIDNNTILLSETDIFDKVSSFKIKRSEKVKIKITNVYVPGSHPGITSVQAPAFEDDCIEYTAKITVTNLQGKTRSIKFVNVKGAVA